MTVPRAVALIEELAATLPADVIVGAGTVLDAETAREVIRAGARFVVSPVFQAEIVDACRDADCAVMPGCFTPTEILAAWEAGADIVKVFPATALGPGFFKDVRGPLPQVRLMPTGGVTRDNAGDWIRAGAVAIGVGTALVDPAAVEAGRFDLIRDNARRSSTPSRRPASAGLPEWRRDEDRLLRRDHAAAQPAGLRAAVPVADAPGDVRRRRSQRRRQPRAVRLRQPLRHPRAGPRRSAMRRFRRCAPRA